MGRIVPIVYTEVEDYSVKESLKDYLFQNTLDTTNMEEYEEYKDRQKKIRDKNIAILAEKENKHIKSSTVIFGPSPLKGKVILAAEIE